MILLSAADHGLVDETALTCLMSGKWSDRGKGTKKDISKISFAFVQCKKSWFLQLTLANGIS